MIQIEEINLKKIREKNLKKFKKTLENRLKELKIETVNLTPYEKKITEYFVMNSNKTVTSKEILADIWENYRCEDIVSQTIYRTRKKSEIFSKYIKRIDSGYRFDNPNEKYSGIEITPGFMIFPQRQTIRIETKEIEIPKQEFEVLLTLYNNSNYIVKRSNFVNGSDDIDELRNVDSRINILRKKIGPKYNHVIETLKFLGYRLRVEGEPKQKYFNEYQIYTGRRKDLKKA